MGGDITGGEANGLSHNGGCHAQGSSDVMGEDTMAVALFVVHG